MHPPLAKSQQEQYKLNDKSLTDVKLACGTSAVHDMKGGNSQYVAAYI